MKQQPTPIKSQLLQRLDAAIKAAKNPIDAGVHRAGRASLLARHGLIEDARNELVQLHRLAFQVPSPRLSAWLHFAEGITSYFSDVASRPIDKLQRASELAAQSGQRDLQALSQAWLAHLAYVRHALPDLLDHAAKARALAEPDYHMAHFRLALVLGMAHDFAARRRESQAWYGLAHRHATLNGDEASVSALLYNMAERRAGQVRMASLREPTAPVPSLLLGVDSASHYDAAVGGSAWSNMTPLLRAQVLAVQGEHAQARDLFVAHLPQALAEILDQHGAGMLADLAWCHAQLGEHEQARHQIEQASLRLSESCDIDDRAATHGRLAQAHQLLGDEASAARQTAMASTCWTAFAQQQREWGEALVAAGFDKP